MKSVAASVGRTLRTRRKGLRMSQAQVAQATGKTQSQIARLEAGLGDPQLSTLIEVSRSVGVELVPVPIRLLPVVRHLLRKLEDGTPPSPKLFGNDPEDRDDDQEDSDES